MCRTQTIAIYIYIYILYIWSSWAHINSANRQRSVDRLITGLSLSGNWHKSNAIVFVEDVQLCVQPGTAQSGSSGRARGRLTPWNPVLNNPSHPFDDEPRQMDGLFCHRHVPPKNRTVHFRHSIVPAYIWLFYLIFSPPRWVTSSYPIHLMQKCLRFQGITARNRSNLSLLLLFINFIVKVVTVFV